MNGYVALFPTYLDFLLFLRWPFARAYLPGGEYYEGDTGKLVEFDDADDAGLAEYAPELRAWVRWLDTEMSRARKYGPPEDGHLEIPGYLHRDMGFFGRMALVGQWVLLGIESLPAYVNRKGGAEQWQAAFPEIAIEADPAGNVLLHESFLAHLAGLFVEMGTGGEDLDLEAIIASQHGYPARP